MTKPGEPDPLYVPTVRETPRRSREVEPGTLPPGTTLAGRYRILELLGSGGMGVVYRVRDLVLDADIALKILRLEIAEDPAKLAFFRNEVRIARMVTHPNVCRLHDLVEAPDGTFITMEYVDGEPLSTRLRRGKLPLADALRVLRDVASGLAAAHAAGVVHRDLKPSNVLVAGDRIVVADFGIAGEGRHLSVGPQDIAGTHGYMAPEQARGEPLDARADVYALGVLACVLTTGARPMPTVAHTATNAGGGSAAALPVADAAPYLDDLPAALAALIASCLAEDPDDRPADAREVARQLADASPAVPARRRRRAMFAIAAAIVVAGAAIAIPIAMRDHTATTATTIAPRVVVLPIDASALPAADRWLGFAVQRLIVNELVDGWAIDAAAGDAARSSAVAASGRLERDPSGRLRLAFDGASLEAPSARDLALAAAAHLVDARVPTALRHPSAIDLRDAGATDAEAWRMWRRAQREAWLQRWSRTTELCAAASARDPGFALPHFEAAISYDRDDVGNHELEQAEHLLAKTPNVRPFWLVGIRAVRQLWSGDVAAGVKTLDEARALPLEPRERYFLELRWAMSVNLGAEPRAALPALELLTEQYPDDAAAYKLLTAYYLNSDEPTATTLALKYGERAIAIAPDDVGVRADLAVALLLRGRIDEARLRAAELQNVAPDDKRLARGRLYTLHMALGDPSEAEVDARRQLTGSAIQRAEGMASLARLDLYWGRFDAGLRGLAASAAAFDTLGISTSAARERVIAARHAWMLGDRAAAIGGFARVAAGATTYAARAAILASIAAGKLDDARVRAAKLPDGSAERAEIELQIAAAAHDSERVLAAFAHLERLSTTIESLYDVADALERSGRFDEAAAAFERLARSPHAWSEPVASTRAWYRLGLLRERAHDTTGAKNAFEEVVRRWGAAAAPARELDDARRHLR